MAKSHQTHRIVISGLITFLLVSHASATELHLKFKDEHNHAVPLSKAELLFVAWGAADRLELPIDGNLLALTLDESWLRSKWPTRFNDMEKIYLYLQADGYAAIRSEPFLWIGAHGPPPGTRVNLAKISFPGGKGVVIQEGDAAELELVFRRPKGRRLRLVDDDGEPVRGVRVSIFMFWSSSNHCGALAGADPLDETISDYEGRVPVPDGDFEYAFVFQKPLYVLKNPQGFPYRPPRLVTPLNTEETVVQMHRWKKRPLEMRLARGGEPAPGATLLGCLAGCPCGACCGPLGRTDNNGMIRIPEFYPEEWERVFFADDKGKALWEAKPTEWPGTGTIDVDVR